LRLVHTERGRGRKDSAGGCGKGKGRNRLNIHHLRKADNRRRGRKGKHFFTDEGKRKTSRRGREGPVNGLKERYRPKKKQLREKFNLREKNGVGGRKEDHLFKKV